MQTFFNRNAYLLALLIPTAIYILSHVLFEMNAESSLEIKNLIVTAIPKQTKSPASVILEYQRRILWSGSTLLLILTYLGALVWSAGIIRHCYSREHILKLGAIGLPILTLALLQIYRANDESALYNNIYHTTVLALESSPLTHPRSMANILFIIRAINILAAITPVFIMFAISSSIAMPAAVQETGFFIQRMNYLKQGVIIGSAVMIVGIIHMFAWMQLPVAMLGEGATVLANRILDLDSSSCQFWGIVATLSLLSLYAFAAIYWQARTQAALTAMRPDFDIPKWMEENGIALSWKDDAFRFGAMLTPTIISALSHILKMD
ncbi:MAG: hypothetical protein ABSB19_19550 [Methylomonas sp.]|jgi:hypothetical protein